MTRPIPQLGDRFREVRKAAELSIEQLSDFLEITPDQLISIENGNDWPSPDLLNLLARTFGVEVDQLLAGGAKTRPATLLFRTIPDKDLTIKELVNGDVHLVLGEFLRVVERTSRLRHQMGITQDLSWLDKLPVESPPDDDDELHKRAEEQAEAARELFGLGLDPIPSVTELLRRLGVSLYFVTPEELDQNVEGASTRSPVPAILINVIYGQDIWWAIRMGLAHELAHLVLDRSDGQPGMLMLSPVVREGKKLLPRWRVTPDHGRVEKRANSFAANFLAPPKAVAKLITGDPTSRDAIGRVVSHFGLGRITAINVLRDTFGLPRAVRQQMLDKSVAKRDKVEFSEEFDLGLHAGELCTLTLAALKEKLIDPVEARRLLDIPLTEKLPPHEGINRQPLLSIEGVMLRRVQCHLSQENPGLIVQQIKSTSTGWDIEIVEYTGHDTRKPCRTLHLGFNQEVQEIVVDDLFAE